MPPPKYPPPTSADDIVNAIKGLSPAQRQEIAESLAVFFWQTQRNRALQDVRNTIAPRILVSGNEINKDQSGNPVGFGNTGHSQFPVVNFIGATGAVDSSTNGVQADITVGGGGADCMFNVLASPCFATLAGWTEGQVFTSLSGCTFSTTATAQKTADYIRDVYGGVGTAFFCKGSYSGGLHIHHDLKMDVVGAGRDTTTIYGANSNGSSYVIDSGTGVGAAAVVSYRDLTIDGTQGPAPGTAVFGNPNGSVCYMESCNIIVPASNNGAQWNGNETLSNIRITGPGSGTQANTGCTSANNSTTPHHLNNLYISGCAVGMQFTNAALWDIDNVYITGANAAKGSASGAGGISFHTSGGLSNSKLTGITIVDSVVGFGFTNDSGSSNTLGDLVFKNVTTAMDIRGSTTGIHDWVFNGGVFILGTAGDTGVDFTQASNGHCTYCQFTNLNFRGYASGNEIINASGTHIGTGTVGYHNVSDAGTVADFGSPQGHTAGGTGTSAPSNATFVTVANESALLPNSRQDTAGSGISKTDGGAGSTLTWALGNLTANWTQAGVFDISQAGNLTVLKHAAIGAGSAIDPATILSLQETFADPAGARQALAGNLIATLTADNANALAGLSYTALVTGAHTLSGIVSAVQGTAMAGSGATLSDARVFDAIGGLFLTAAATMTKLALFYGRNPTAANLSVGTLYGLYLENLAKGTTNWAIASLGGKSYFAGAMRIGGTAGSAETAPDSKAILELNATGLGLLLPRMATASAPASATDGMLWYDSTTARLRGRENALDRNVLQRLSKTITVLSPLATDNINMGDFLPACTVEEVRVVLVGSATPSTSYNLVYSTDRSAAGTKLWTADKTTTSTTTGDTFTSFDNPAMGADVWLRLVMSAVSGTVTEISVTVWYRET